MIQSLRRLLAISILLGIASTTLFAADTIRITIGEWPPFTSKDLPYYGIGSRIVTNAFALEGVRVEYGFFPWPRALALAREGEWDGSFLWNRTTEREKYFLYTDSVFEGRFVFFHLKSYPFDWETMDDLQGIQIGGILEYNFGEAFRNALAAGKLEVQWVPSFELNISKLLAGRVNVALEELNAGYHMLRKNVTPEEFPLFTHHPKPIPGIFNYSLLLSRKLERNQRFVTLFNQGLKRLTDKGEISQYWHELRNDAQMESQFEPSATVTPSE